MKYTKEILKEWAGKFAPNLPLVGNDLDQFAAAWAQEVAELRDLCRLMVFRENRKSDRFKDLWAKHMKGGEG